MYFKKKKKTVTCKIYTVIKFKLQTVIKFIRSSKVIVICN